MRELLELDDYEVVEIDKYHFESEEHQEQLILDEVEEVEQEQLPDEMVEMVVLE